MMIEVTEICQLVIDCAQERVDYATKVIGPAHIQNHRITPASKKGLNIFFKIIVFLLNFIEFTKLDNHFVSATASCVERLHPFHACTTMAWCQRAHKNAFCLVK